MSVSETRIIDENSCYDEILNCFIKSMNDNRKKEICKDKSIIKLMKMWREHKQKYTREILKNLLIFVITLFEDENNPPDLYNTIGKESSSLKNNEREEYISMLKTEFIC
jgi:hypothetical protein